MKHAYHLFTRLAEEAWAAIDEERPANCARAAMLKDHYGAPGADLYYALRFLCATDFRDAAKTCHLETGRSPELIQREILSALNKGPKEWLDQKRDFLRKGLLYTSRGYSQLPHLLLKIPDFKSYLAAIPPGLLPIFEEAACFVIPRRPHAVLPGVAIGPRLLPYIALQLAKDGPRKDFRLNALSLQTRPHFHAAYIMQAHQAVTAIAARLGQALPVHNKPMTEAPAALHSDIRVVRKPPRLDQKEARRDAERALRRLVNTGKITRLDAQIYLKTKGVFGTYNHIAHTMDLPLSEIEQGTIRVEKALAKLKKAAKRAPSSNRDFHQARPVRP
jgi:hypothetical protein